ncbi:ArnT family glycosyltransferase [Thermogemmata fonticola]|uniref:Glycosyltransferase RgtA/B/C/D-like domain-containing protein n=1 Tax=Thermogemmata fonticola TaxID=2755323 RepID=A0A7V9AAD2_9BACT|nr:hypothetical protein [Thermogemmata fonticola]MBA2224888.1 hypothetical protein [Thermogemmata fonticola]
MSAEQRFRLPLSALDRFWRSQGAIYPLLLATVVTTCNAAKPVVIDDTAYLLYARHIAQHPLDPYGFTIFWYDQPESAFEVLAPPVYLYWLAAGWQLFGDQIVWLKLWTWPWLILLAYGLRSILRYFAGSAEGWMLAVLMLSPAILPAVNLMLDVPAYALGVTALAVWCRAGHMDWRGGAWFLALMAGALLGLAMQTKYTLLTFVPVLLLGQLPRRRWSLTLAASFTAIAIFLAWEGFCLVRYGNSHFWYHASSQAHSSLWEQWQAKAALTGPLLGYWGYFGAAIGLIVVLRLGLPRRPVYCAACFWLVGALLASCVPEHFLLLSDQLSLPVLFWQVAGCCSGIVIVLGLLALAFSPAADPAEQKLSRFLVLWWGVELAGYYLLTPFGAARRLIGLTLVTHLAAARLYSQGGELPRYLLLSWENAKQALAVQGPHRLPVLLAALSLVAGGAIAAVDLLDAQAEKWCVEQAAAVLQELPERNCSRIWFAGHWGFQYYAQRLGWEHIVPGSSHIRPEDFAVLPVPPKPGILHRPHIGSIPILLPEGNYDTVAEVIWDDPIAAQTIPNYYGGSVALIGRSHPRLRVVVARLRSDWYP